MSKIRTIYLDVFHVEVGVFRKDSARMAFLKSRGVDVVPTGSCFGSAHMDKDAEGTPFFSMVLSKKATKATWAHECVHIADFLMGRLGIPTGARNTEVRAYIVGCLFDGLENLFD